MTHCVHCHCADDAPHYPDCPVMRRVLPKVTVYKGNLSEALAKARKAWDARERDWFWGW